MKNLAYTWRGKPGFSGLRREPAVSLEDLMHICVSYWKVDSDPLEKFEVEYCLPAFSIGKQYDVKIDKVDK